MRMLVRFVFLFFGASVYADFDLDYYHTTAADATSFTASTQSIKPQWWLGLDKWLSRLVYELESVSA